MRKPKQKPAPEKVECLTYTIAEVARVLGIGRNSAYSAAISGDIPTIRIGRLIRIPKKAVEDMLVESQRSIERKLQIVRAR